MEDIAYLRENVYSVQFASMPDFIVRMQAAKFIPHTDMEKYPTVKKNLEQRKNSRVGRANEDYAGSGNKGAGF